MATLPVGVLKNDPNRGATSEQQGMKPPPGFNSWDEYNYWKQNQGKGKDSYNLNDAKSLQQELTAKTAAEAAAKSPVSQAPSFFGGSQPVSKTGFTSMFGPTQNPTSFANQWTGTPANTATPGSAGPMIQSQPQGGVKFGGLTGGATAPYQVVNAGTRSEGYYDPMGQFQYGKPPQGAQAPNFASVGQSTPQTGGFTMQPGMSPVGTATPGSYAPPVVPGQTFTAAPGSTVQGTSFGPDNTLRNQQFLPGNTQNPYDAQAIAALNAVQGANVTNPYDIQAAQSLGGANLSTEFSPMVGETRDMVLNRLRGLAGPDRTQLAKEAFDIFQQQNEPRYQQELRGVGQKAAALGRVGAGLTTNELTDVWSQRNRDLDLMQRGLINDAAGQTMQDRLNALQGTLSGSQTLEGQDFNRQSAAANLALNKAGQYGQLGQNQFGREQSNVGLGLDKANILRGMGESEFGRGQQNYQQASQERAYQDYLARTALEDRVRQQEMEQQQAQREWDRQAEANRLAAQLAGQQNTSYPGIAQPQGDSFGTGQVAGAGAPQYPTGGGGYTGPQIATLPWTPPPSNPGLGLQDNPYPLDPNSIFQGEGLGLQGQRFGLAE